MKKNAFAFSRRSGEKPELIEKAAPSERASAGIAQEDLTDNAAKNGAMTPTNDDTAPQRDEKTPNNGQNELETKEPLPVSDESMSQTGQGEPDADKTASFLEGAQPDGGFTGEEFGSLYALAGQFPEQDVARDVTSKAFRLFAAGKHADVAQIYADFLAFRQAAAQEILPCAAPASRQSVPNGTDTPQDAAVPNAEGMSEESVLPNGALPSGFPREYSMFSGGTAVPDYGVTLTARQMELVRESGMSYREYAALLASVPSKRRQGIR